MRTENEFRIIIFILLGIGIGNCYAEINQIKLPRQAREVLTLIKDKEYGKMILMYNNLPTRPVNDEYFRSMIDEASTFINIYGFPTTANTTWEKVGLDLKIVYTFPHFEKEPSRVIELYFDVDMKLDNISVFDHVIEREEENSKLKSNSDRLIEYFIFKEWREDSCTFKRDRSRIGLFISENKFLDNKSIKYVDSLLGKPNEIDLGDSGMVEYLYKIDTKNEEKDNCNKKFEVYDQSEILSILFKSERVLDCGLIIAD